MTLPAGPRLGPYEILSPLGAGGMGEVYKARDTQLERTVAIKVLPQNLSSSPEVRQRFEREAKTISLRLILASLIACDENHDLCSLRVAGLSARGTTLS